VSDCLWTLDPTTTNTLSAWWAPIRTHLVYANFLEGVLQSFEVLDVLVFQSCGKLHSLQDNATWKKRKGHVTGRAMQPERSCDRKGNAA